MTKLLVQLFVCLTLLGLPGWGMAAEFVDDNGRTIRFDKPFSRIISLYAAHTENLFSLGLAAEIIGVARNDDFPAAARTKRKFHYREDAEKFIAARPDLVLVRPMIMRSYPHLMEQLAQAGIQVVSLQPTSVSEMFSYWHQLGLLTGRQSEARAMEARFQQEWAALAGHTAALEPGQRQRVYFEAIHRRMKTFMPTSLAIFALESAGGINIAADAGQVRSTNIAYYGKERILAKGGDIDVFLAQQGVMNRVDEELIRQEPGFMAIKAVQEGRICFIDEKLVSRPTLRLLEGIRQIGGMLYPEFFQELSGSGHAKQSQES
ncbi:MAG: ABC transporter substrate-binding protein [Desulfurivibrionaceae bacterium]|nr:ABC transporter substrate-binding protein [Desulfurivibrionaceae bacterium]